MRAELRATGVGPLIVTAAGARATEERVLADLGALLPSSAADAGLLARPIVVVVPSRSLRLHLAARLVAVRGRAVVGVEIVTLHSLAARVVARHGEEPHRPGTRLLPVLVGRFAAFEPALRLLATAIEDGVSPLVATVRDLLDAGLTPAAADALADLLEGQPEEAERERAAALVRTASAVARVLEAGALDLAADVLRRAVALLKAEPEASMPARAVLIHGFADATAVATDLIETLLSRCGARIYLDRPPDPVDPSKDDLGVAFSNRFLERLERVATRIPADAKPSQPPKPEMFRAPGTQAEVREVARRIRVLLDGGVQPESIGVVARDLYPYSLAIHTHFTRLGIPFSALDTAGSLDAAGRRVRALADLLRRGSQTPADSWLSAAGGLTGFDLRLALHVCGAARVHDVAGLDADALLDESGDLVLPIRRGLAELPGDGESGEAVRVAPRRRLAGVRLRRAVKNAAAFVKLLESWPTDAKPAEHLRRLERLLAAGLGWRRTLPGVERVAAALSTLAAELPEALALSREEFFMVVRRDLEEIGANPLGGAGGGVQVLSVTEARARTFEHLFLIGLNQDSFPRQVREDPLLPDRLRQAIERDVLPQVPVKRVGFDEERYLFAQLFSSSAHVTLSSQVCDDDGKARALSPLVARLCLAGGIGEPPLVGSALTPVPGELRPPDEHAVLAGLHSSRRAFGRALEVACGGSAATRLAVLDELDPDRATAEGRERAAILGPYLGFVGAPREGADPRRGEPAVTTAENVAACPWQAFLRRIVRLEPSPDPLAAAPGVDALVLGQTVHRALEAVFAAGRSDLPRTVGSAAAARPFQVGRPAPGEIGAAVREASRSVARQEGLTMPGLERVVEERARPYLEAAGQLLWPEDTSSVSVLGLEVSGVAVLDDADGTTHGLAFRADLMEESGGGVRLTDFKTGKPLSTAKTDRTRHNHLLAAIRRGQALQAGAYALAVPGRTAQGRYLYLRPDLEESGRLLAIASDDPALAPAFSVAGRAILGAWQRGSFFPRLEEPDAPKEPRRCEYCEVRDACERGDSGARRRLARWAAARRESPDELGDAEAALLGLWSLAGGGAVGGEEGEE